MISLAAEKDVVSQGRTAVTLADLIPPRQPHPLGTGELQYLLSGTDAMDVVLLHFIL